ncbi:MAG TPA: tRNA preQ1(34) S-adenosylmethionine ribosyltransferase-isomerase QueA [Candidatus Saccharimonadales bacterium]|nr:tRNA preQ1(34) S-adenosylmethionine ribosyltransferase-isomerase QueA [Candidatus Saccharimonadales bacterium]
MRTADFDFVLPPELIAQDPAPRRDESRLLVLHRASERIAHRKFRDVREYLRQGDVLVLNNSRVIPARLRGTKVHSGGQIEILLLEENARNDWQAMLRPAKRARPGTQMAIQDADGRATDVHATVRETNDEGHRRLQFSGTPDIRHLLDRLGEVPLPPYIMRTSMNEDKERYQTVYAKTDGSVAAPTAGLHFTRELLEQIRADGVRICFLTLHVGPGTFLPVKAEILAAHQMHEERFELDEATAQAVNEAKAENRRVIAVGTTTVRVLESVAAQNGGKLLKTTGKTGIFIHPSFQFQIVDALLTNFHLPRSTLLMLVSAFAAPGETRGREMILSAYAEAIRERYRFFSYGDAMLIL